MNEKKVRLPVHVQPNARRNEVLGFREGVLHLKIAAPPIKGRANLELVDYLADILGIAKCRVTIDKGAAGRNKLVEIAGFKKEEIIDTLSGAKR